jgi:hypothetical protein
MAACTSRYLRFALWILCAAALFGGCASGGVKGPILLHPLPDQLEGYNMSGGAVIFDTTDVTVTARPLDWRVVEKRYEREELTVPYGDEPGLLAHFVFFSLRFDNRSPNSINFMPRQAAAYSDEKNFVVPIDITDVYLHAIDPGDAEERARSFRLTTYDGTIVIPPGESREKYLVFTRPEGEVKTLKLTLDNIYLGTKSADLSFLFEAFPGDDAP